MRLGVVADTRHHLDADGRPATLEPVAAQLEQFATMFDEVVLLAPLWPGPAPAGFRPYRAPNISLRPVRPGGGDSLRAKAGLAARLPAWSAAIARLLPDVDALHMRCPSGLGLLGIVAARASGRPRAAMYAGSWAGYPGEPRSYRLQRRMLGRPSFGGPVTVYAADPGPGHLVSFFSPSFTLAEWEAEATVVASKLRALRDVTVGERSAVRLVTVGHVDRNKDQAVVVRAVDRLRRRGVDASLDIVGDGPLLDDVGRLSASLGLEAVVRLHGRLPLDGVRRCYRQADVNVLASQAEGYPKVVVEGMVAGAVPVTSPFALSRPMLGGGRRGVVFPAGDPEALADAVGSLLADPPRWAAMVAAGREYARTVSLEAFGARLREVLEGGWGVALPLRLEPQP